MFYDSSQTALYTFPTRRSSDLTPSPVMMNQPVSLPALPWVTYRRQTFSKLLLLALGFFLLVCLARLLFRTGDRKSTRLNSSHTVISYAVFCWKKKSTHT